MATKKSKQADKPSLTVKERQQLRKTMTSASKITEKDLMEMLRKDPDGKLSINVVLDAMWPKFRELFKIGMPAKTKGTPDAVYQKQLDDYRKWTAGIKSIARYWYCCGMMHKQNLRDILHILDVEKDAEAPAEAPVDKPVEAQVQSAK